MNEITDLLHIQQEYFKTQKTKSVAQRKQLLKNLRSEIVKQEAKISDALYKDFKKSVFESYLTEIGIVLSELDQTISKLNRWTKPKRVRSTLLNFPSRDFIYPEPYGSTLIIAPWNYPFHLAIAPLVGAIAAGNTAVLKPSELTPNTSKIISDIIEVVFDKAHAAVVEGGVDTSTALLSQKWDYIFFTGSVPVGRIVAKAAAEHLTPVTLELGGKSPCIIDESAPIKLAAKRIVWGKFVNAGQTCIAPDYVLIKDTHKALFFEALKAEIEKAYTLQPERSDDYPRIVNEKNFNRLSKMITNQIAVIGGETNAQDLYISPTVLDNPSLNSEVMKDEIFGPILPVISYSSMEDISEIINNYDKPLSFYIFSRRSSFIKTLLKTFSFGGGVINDTLVHFANDKLPFGGVGNSGIGAYHGKSTFDTFSHNKGVVKRANWLDIPFRYAPYKGKLNLIKKVLKYLS